MKTNENKLIEDHIPLYGHTILVGKSGSGKSNVIMSQIINRIKEKHIIFIIDTKRELRQLFKNHCTIVGTEDSEKIFKKLLDIIDVRSKLFDDTANKYKKPVRDLEEYYEVTGRKLEYISLVVEELILLREYVSESLLIQLLVAGRSSGVFILSAVQYLTAEVLSRKGSTSFHNRIFLGKEDRIAMKILFGKVDTKLLSLTKDHLGKSGHGILETDDSIKKVIFPRIHDYMLEEWM